MKKFTSLALAGLMVLMVLASGCASCPRSGRFTIGTWDSRDGEQLMAAQASDNVVWSNNGVGDRVTPRVFEWAALFTMISMLKVKIQIVNIEWSDK